MGYEKRSIDIGFGSQRILQSWYLINVENNNDFYFLDSCIKLSRENDKIVDEPNTSIDNLKFVSFLIKEQTGERGLKRLLIVDLDMRKL